MPELELRTRQIRFDLDDGELDGNTLVGIAVPFGSPTRIDNPFEGKFDEEFEHGAFKRTLSKAAPVLQFDHGTHPLIGSIPIGTFDEIREIDEGLYFRAPLLRNWLVEPLRDAIKARAINGVSIRFRPRKVDVVPDGYEDGVQLQRVTEAELPELGPVVFPAYEQTQVELRHLDLSKEDDRRRLAEALLGGVSLDRGGRGHPLEPGTDPEAGSPAVKPDHVSDSVTPHSNRSRARKRRLKLMEYENGLGSSAGSPA